MSKDIESEWCNNCRKHHISFTTVKIEKEKRGLYYPYRDTMEAEPYYYTEITKKCNRCGNLITVSEDAIYHMSESRFEKYGRHSHYDT